MRHAAALKQRYQVLARAHEKAKRVAARRAARRAARESAAVRGQRVEFAAEQVAWAVAVIGATPLTMFAAGQSIEAAVGDSACWVVPAFCAFVFLLGYCLRDEDGDFKHVCCHKVYLEPGWDPMGCIENIHPRTYPELRATATGD